MAKRRAGSTTSWLRILALFTLASFIEATFYGQMSAFTPLYLPRLGIAPENIAYWTGLLATVTGIAGIPFLPFWGALADRFARQPVIIRSFAAHLAAASVALLARNVWVFAIGRSLMSLSLGNSGLMLTTLTENTPDRRQALAFSIMNGAAPVGVFIGPLIGGPIVDRWGFPTLLAIDAVLMLSIILLLSLGYRDSFTGTHSGSLLKMASDSIRIILQSGRLRTLFPALIVLFAGWMLALTYVPLVITALYPGQNQGSIVGLVLGIGGLTALVISPFFGALADRFGLLRVLFIGACVEVLLWPIPAFTRSLTGFIIAWSLLNGIASSVFAISFTVLSRSAEAKVRGRVMSFSYLPLNIGVIIGPGIGSLITQGNLFNIFPGSAVLTAVGIGILAFAVRQGVK